MTRKEEILTNAPIGQWVSKTNLMSDYIGDLDLLDSAFRAYDSSVAKSHDSNVVFAINHLWDTIDSINTLLSTGVLSLKNLLVDSATFRIIRTGMLVADSAIVDSAFIRDLRVAGHLNVDSAEFDIINVNTINVDSGGTLYIDSATVNYLNANYILTDSAKVNHLEAGSIIADSATIDSAFINNLTVSQSFTFDSNKFTDAHLLTVKNEAGTIVLAGYMLSTDPNIGTP